MRDFHCLENLKTGPVRNNLMDLKKKQV